MKKQIHPAFIVVAVLIVVVGAAMFLFRAATETPPYPGQNAGHPAAEMAGPAKKDVPNGPVNNAQAKKMNIPGMNPNPPGSPGSTGQ